MANEDTSALKRTEDGRITRGDRTRSSLMEAAFQEIYHHGYQAASLNEILKAANCTKGSLYHHFPDKHALALAAVRENITAHFSDIWFEPLAATTDPLQTIKECILYYRDTTDEERLQFGCPLQNLGQEMSPVDESFRCFLAEIVDDWRAKLTKAIQRGIDHGTVSKEADPFAIAALTISAHQGNISTLKVTRDIDSAQRAIWAFFSYLDSQRQPSSN